MSRSILQFHFLLLLASGFLMSCASTLDYARQNPDAMPGSRKPEFREDKGYTTVSLFNGALEFPSQGYLIDPKSGDYVTDIRVEKDVFEDILSVLTLGTVDIAQVRYNHPDPSAATPFHAGFKPATFQGKFQDSNCSYPGKESWLLLGLIPIDGGIDVSSEQNPDCYFDQYKIEKSWLTNSGLRGCGDFLVDAGKIVIFTPVSSVLSLCLVKDPTLRWVLAAPGFGAVEPFRVTWTTRSKAHHPVPLKPKPKVTPHP